MRTFLALVLGVSLTASLSACGGSTNNNPDVGGTPDLSPAGFDMSLPGCVMTTPTTGVEFLNACTTAQPGDPAKDYPYFPALAPGGTLPPLN